jgi:hypothetical protein
MRSLDMGLVLRFFAPVNTICSRNGSPDRDAAKIGLMRILFDPATVELVNQFFKSGSSDSNLSPQARPRIHSLPIDREERADQEAQPRMHLGSLALADIGCTH